ncbi:MAG: alpha amylase N-terminal ig-like domain-containing protein [Anaerolineae bacterium]
MNFSEVKYFGKVGFLYPYDIRYDAADRAFCNPLSDGRVQFRLLTELACSEAFLVYNDGTPHGAAMRAWAADSRFRYWETIIAPAAPRLTYSFALKMANGRLVYFCKHGVDHAVEPLDRWELDLAHVTPFETPDWAKGAVIYQIFPERFANGDPANDPPGVVPWGSPPRWLEYQGGDLAGIVQHLDYLADLGVDILYLTPVFHAPSTHKYDCMDYYHVDPAFGGDEALHELVDALHRRGMKLVLDASFNHCHPRFFAFQDLLAHGPDSRYRDWFTVNEWPIRIKVRPHRTLHIADHRRSQYMAWLQTFPQVTGIPFETLDDDGPALEPTYLAWYNVLDMPKLNQRNPETRAYFMAVTQYWLREFGIDGWRMDVAQHIEPDFWADFRRAAKAVRPDCYLLAEIWGNTSPWLQGDQFDATMNYIFRDLCVAYFAQRALSTADFLEGITRMLSLYAPQVTAVTHNLISSHDVARFRHEAGEDVRRLRLATIFQLTMPGAAGIYYGDEIGMSGGEDPDCRRAFPWDRPDTWDRALLETVRTLIRLRREHPALRLGEWRPVWATEEAFAFERAHAEERILVLINRNRPLERVTLPAEAAGARVLWGTAHLAADREALTVMGLAPWDGVVIGWSA